MTLPGSPWVAAQGNLCTVRRAADTTPAGGGGSTVRVWSTASSPQLSEHDGVSERAQRIFAEVEQIDLVAFAEGAADILVRDGLRFEAGDHSGEFYHVEGRRKARHAMGHMLLALTKVTDGERFGL